MNRNYHVFSNGELSRKDNSLILDTGDEKNYMPVEDVEALYLHGQVDFNTRVLSFCREKNIELHVFDWMGRYSGSFIPPSSTQSGTLVVEQVSAYKNTGTRRIIASEMVRAGIHNMKKNLTYYNRKVDSDLGGYKSKLDTVESEVQSALSIEEILGAEATARKEYYSSFAHILPDEFEFDKRIYNPPNGKVNAMMSYLNALLYSSITSAINATGLDPNISYLHEPRSRRPSLALDIADIFKPLFVDRIIFRLTRRGEVEESDFRSDLDGTLLSESGRKKVGKAYEEELKTTVEHKVLKRNVSYKYLLQIEAYNLKNRLISGEDYNAFRKWW